MRLHDADVGKTGEGTLGGLRERNRQRVLGALRERGPTSQADIARTTGLSRTTVSKLVGELKGSGLVDSLEVRRSGSRGVRGGRPAPPRSPRGTAAGGARRRV